MSDELTIDMVRKLGSMEQRLDSLNLPEVGPGADPTFRFAMFQMLTGLRGFWPMSAIGGGAAAADQSGLTQSLTYNGNPVYGYEGLVPYIEFDGAGDYLSRLDNSGFDITGTEAYIATPGLTIGGWFRPGDIVNQQSIMSKWSAAPNLSYLLQVRGDVAGDPARFYISDDGTNSDSVDSSNGITLDGWAFIVGRFNDADAGAELAVWLNGIQTTAVTARNSIFSGTADFNIGGNNNGSNLYTGRASIDFLCAAALSDDIINALFAFTRGILGV